jgi:MraZ protein
MFMGEYSHALDTKGRLMIPARFREELRGGLVITRGYDPCLLIYSSSAWEELAHKVAQLPTTSRNSRAYGRLVFGGAFEATPDKMGRVLIPSVLREYADIKNEATVVGVNTYIEVWDPQRWQDTLALERGDLEAILSDVMRMGI